MSRFHTVLVLPMTALLLNSCTTFGTGLLNSPPGVNYKSFRECLIYNGFFNSTQLMGEARTDDEALKFGKSPRPRLTRIEILKMKGISFTAKSGKIIFDGLLPHQQYGDVEHGTDLLEWRGNHPYGIDIAGKNLGDKDLSGTVPADKTLPDDKINRYLDCYLAPTGPLAAPDKPGLPATNLGDYDLEGRVLRAHILVALLAQYGTELITSHSSSRQATYAAMLLKDIAGAEMQLRVSSPVVLASATGIDPGGLKMIGARAVACPNTAAVNIPVAAPAPAPGNKAPADPLPCVAYAADIYNKQAQIALRWNDRVNRILTVFQVAKDDEMIDAGQSLNRLNNIVAAIAKPTPAALQGLLKDALGGLGSMQKVTLYGDALLRDGRETLAVHGANLKIEPMPADGAIDNGSPYEFAPQLEAKTMFKGWTLWDTEIKQACTVLAAIAKDTSTACVPQDSALAARVKALLPPSS